MPAAANLPLHLSPAYPRYEGNQQQTLNHQHQMKRSYKSVISKAYRKSKPHHLLSPKFDVARKRDEIRGEPLSEESEIYTRKYADDRIKAEHLEKLIGTTREYAFEEEEVVFSTPTGEALSTVERKFTVPNSPEDVDERKSSLWNFERVPPPRRIGAVCLKVGCVTLWDEWGERYPATVLYVDNNSVMQVKREFKQNRVVEDGKISVSDKRNYNTKMPIIDDGYNAVQIGAGNAKLKNVNRPALGHATRHNRGSPPDTMMEFRVEVSTVDCVGGGAEVHARQFLPGQLVDVQGISKGKGYQGAMKRHNFKGGPASHGNSKNHRALGATGNSQDPGKVWKGKKMAGRMGGTTVTVQNLRVIKIDPGRNLIYVIGQVPGNKGSYVKVKDAVKGPGFGTPLVDSSRSVPFPLFVGETGVDGSGNDCGEEWMPKDTLDPLDPSQAFAQRTWGDAK